MNPVVEEERTCAERSARAEGAARRGERKIKAMPGRPNALPDVIYMAEKDAIMLCDLIEKHYQFRPSLQYAADLIAFVEVLPRVSRK